MSSQSKYTGTVKWFDHAQGYGFILGEDGEDVFVHHSAIQQQGYRSLATGQQVEYCRVRSEKGWQAAEVMALAQDQPSGFWRSIAESSGSIGTADG